MPTNTDRDHNTNNQAPDPSELASWMRIQQIRIG